MTDSQLKLAMIEKRWYAAVKENGPLAYLDSSQDASSQESCNPSQEHKRIHNNRYKLGTSKSEHQITEIRMNFFMEGLPAHVGTKMKDSPNRTICVGPL